MSTATDSELVAVGERFEKLLLEYLSSWLDWAPVWLRRGPKGEKRPADVIGVAMCGHECERWVYKRILRDACRQPQQAARPSGRGCQ